MDLQLQGKTAIVTGGSAGIGLAIARLLAEEGVEVTIPGRNRQKLHEVIASLRGAVQGIEADLGTSAGALTLIEQVPETDILVNNLGIYESKPFADVSRGGLRGQSPRRHSAGATLLSRELQRNWGQRLLSPAKSPIAPSRHDALWRDEDRTSGRLTRLAEMTKGTRVTVNAVLPGPTHSEAIVDYLQGLASTPNATPEQAEQEFFGKHRPTSLLSGWRKTAKWPR